jgi:hypothetical protein
VSRGAGTDAQRREVRLAGQADGSTSAVNDSATLITSTALVSALNNTPAFQAKREAYRKKSNEPK